MRPLTVAFIALFATLSPAIAEDADPLFQALAGWQPQAFERADEQVTVALAAPQITQEVLKAVVGIGVCSPAVKEADGLAGLKRVVILNQAGASGWRVDEPAAICADLAGQSPRDRMYMMTILFNAHLI
ncbi:MAG: hypothetical protein ACPGOV_11900 [Magnetovibrionaceae bacterium]